MDLREEGKGKRPLGVTIINLISETIPVALPLPSKHSQTCSHLSQQSSLFCILDCFSYFNLITSVFSFLKTLLKISGSLIDQPFNISVACMITFDK